MKLRKGTNARAVIMSKVLGGKIKKYMKFVVCESSC